jgi:hypothetical protein
MKDRILEIVKKNLISIIAGVIAIAAIGVAFTTLASEKETLQKDLDARKAAYTSLDGLRTAQRTLPTVKLGDSAAEPLTKFPSLKIIEQGDVIVKELEKASKEIYDAAVAMNKHAPLVQGSLPAPDSPSALGFRQAYQRYFLPGQNPNPMQSQFARDLVAGMPPTAEDIKLKLDTEAKVIRDKKLFFNAQGQPANAQQVKDEIDEMARNLPGDLRKKIAETSKVYINPNSFMAHRPILDAPGAPDEENIYAAQITLWLQQDIVAAVNDANANRTRS